MMNGGAQSSALLVRIGAGTMGVDIGEISEIIRMVDIERLPSGGAVLGAISLRGQVLPVLDVGPALQQGAVAIDPAHYIVVAASTTPFGFCVHDAIDVIDVAEDQRREVWGERSGGRFVRGMLRHDETLVPLLSTRAMEGELE
ncbi:MAG: chemotaxis protein CheW [Thermoanaerobaculia bacterium]|jgi:chemotaxis signal transduction protein